MITHEIRAWMITRTNITNLLASTKDIRTGPQPQRSSRSFINIQLIREFPTFRSGSVSPYTECQVEVHCEAETDALAATLAEAVKDEVASFARGTMNNTFINAITSIDVRQRQSTNASAGEALFPAYTLTITLDYTDA